MIYKAAEVIWIFLAGRDGTGIEGSIRCPRGPKKTVAFCKLACTIVQIACTIVWLIKDKIWSAFLILVGSDRRQVVWLLPNSRPGSIPFLEDAAKYTCPNTNTNTNTHASRSWMSRSVRDAPIWRNVLLGENSEVAQEMLGCLPIQFCRYNCTIQFCRYKAARVDHTHARPRLSRLQMSTTQSSVMGEDCFTAWEGFLVCIFIDWN